MIKEVVLPQLAAAKPQSNLDPLCEYYYQLLGKKITLIAANGTVLGDSDLGCSLKSENFQNRPEIQQALVNGLGDHIFVNSLTGESFLYVAIKAETDEAVVGYVHLTMPLADVQSNQRNIRNFILTTTFFTSIITASGIAHRRPLHEAGKGTDQNR